MQFIKNKITKQNTFKGTEYNFGIICSTHTHTHTHTGTFSGGINQTTILVSFHRKQKIRLKVKNCFISSFLFTKICLIQYLKSCFFITP